MTTRLVGAALAALALLPATAQAAALNPIKPCYISVTQDGPPQQITREALDVGGSSFTPGSLVDVSVDGKVERTVQVDAAGNLPSQVLESPYQPRGQGTFVLTAAERGNPINSVSLQSRTTALTLRLPSKADPPSKRIHFRGSGFTQQKTVWAHYLYKGRVRKTVRMVKRIKNPCGVFSVHRKQIPFTQKKLLRMTGRWRIQVDQQRKYSRAPDSVFVRVDIDVRLKSAKR